MIWKHIFLNLLPKLFYMRWSIVSNESHFYLKNIFLLFFFNKKRKTGKYTDVIIININNQYKFVNIMLIYDGDIIAL